MDKKNKTYQFTSDQIEIVSFDKPWFLVHLSINNEEITDNTFFPTLEIGVKKFSTIFERVVIKNWMIDEVEGTKKINRLREYLLKEWPDKGVETMKIAMYEQYDSPEFKDQTGRNLLYDGYDFLALTVAHIALRFNDNHFNFEDLHISAHSVGEFLSVNFWDEVKKNATNKMGDTVLK